MKATEPLQTIKPEVRNLHPYSLSPDRARIKLNQNENPWGTPPEVKQETLTRLVDRPWSRYPDFIPVQLHQKLAAFAGWTADGIIAGNGSNELIQAVLMVTLGPGKRLLISEPTFALYKQIGTVLGAGVLSQPLTPELTYDAGLLKKSLQDQRPEVVIICSPNNPTGCVIQHADLAELLELTPGLIVVDEAYFEFSGQTAAPLLERYPNLVVLRTFSKAMAMAGLRVGYLLASPELVREISKAVLPYNLNAISQTAAEVALEMYASSLKPLVEKIISERERVFSRLQGISGLLPVRSRANFMVVKSSVEPARVFKELLRRDILIRDVSRYPLLKDYFRLSIGTTAENDQLLNGLEEIFTGRNILENYEHHQKEA